MELLGRPRRKLSTRERLLRSHSRSPCVYVFVHLGKKLAIILGSTFGGLILLGSAICLIICARRNKSSNTIKSNLVGELTFSFRSILGASR
jgi:hypothetical protein